MAHRRYQSQADAEEASLEARLATQSPSGSSPSVVAPARDKGKARQIDPVPSRAEDDEDHGQEDSEGEHSISDHFGDEEHNSDHFGDQDRIPFEPTHQQILAKLYQMHPQARRSTNPERYLRLPKGVRGCQDEFRAWWDINIAPTFRAGKLQDAAGTLSWSKRCWKCHRDQKKCTPAKTMTGTSARHCLSCGNKACGVNGQDPRYPWGIRLATWRRLLVQANRSSTTYVPVEAEIDERDEEVTAQQLRPLMAYPTHQAALDAGVELEEDMRDALLAEEQRGIHWDPQREPHPVLVRQYDYWLAIQNATTTPGGYGKEPEPVHPRQQQQQQQQQQRPLQPPQPLQSSHQHQQPLRSHPRLAEAELPIHLPQQEAGGPSRSARGRHPLPSTVTLRPSTATLRDQPSGSATARDQPSRSTAARIPPPPPPRPLRSQRRTIQAPISQEHRTIQAPISQEHRTIQAPISHALPLHTPQQPSLQPLLSLGYRRQGSGRSVTFEDDWDYDGGMYDPRLPFESQRTHTASSSSSFRAQSLPRQRQRMQDPFDSESQVVAPAHESDSHQQQSYSHQQQARQQLRQPLRHRDSLELHRQQRPIQEQQDLFEAQQRELNELQEQCRRDREQLAQEREAFRRERADFLQSMAPREHAHLPREHAHLPREHEHPHREHEHPHREHEHPHREHEHRSRPPRRPLPPVPGSPLPTHRGQPLPTSRQPSSNNLFQAGRPSASGNTFIFNSGANFYYSESSRP
ncbi:unnamed protein product [Sympodiomycopsis kandeliae]